MKENGTMTEEYLWVEIDYTENFKYYIKPYDEFKRMHDISMIDETLTRLIISLKIINDLKHDVIIKLEEKRDEAVKYLKENYNYGKHDFRNVWRFETSKQVTKKELREHTINKILK